MTPEGYERTTTKIAPVGSSFDLDIDEVTDEMVVRFGLTREQARVLAYLYAQLVAYGDMKVDALRALGPEEFFNIMNEKAWMDFERLQLTVAQLFFDLGAKGTPGNGAELKQLLAAFGEGAEEIEAKLEESAPEVFDGEYAVGVKTVKGGNNASKEEKSG